MRWRRGLSADDRAVWESVARTARPRRAEVAARPEAAPAPALPARPSEERGFLKPRGDILRRGAAHGGAHGAGEPAWPRARPSEPSVPQAREGDRLPGPVGRPEPGLDRRTAERLRRGEREPDMRLDLHGMTAERAHRALDRFVAQAIGRGARMVLVITGKGGRRAADDAPWLPAGRGVLRDAAPRWLRHGPHGRRIIGIYEAHIRHGGSGAFYVYLKKPR